MTQNPFRDSRQRVQRQQGQFALGVGRVMQVPDASAHEVVVKPLTSTGAEQTESAQDAAVVLVAAKGDIALPSVDDLVVFGKLESSDKIILGTLYSRASSIREYAADERHVGREAGGETVLHGSAMVAPTRTEDPADATDGALWYRTDLDEYRGVENGNTVRFDTTQV